MVKTIKIGKRAIGEGHPAYIIAEIGSNFDGDLDRAKHLADLAKAAGADAYKIQNFLAPKIVSNVGFAGLKVAHQAKWDKPVVEVYRKAEFPREWIKELSGYCKKIGIDFLSSPYDTEAVDVLEKIGVAAHKLGAGEIDNLDFLTYVAKTGKPVILSVGAAMMQDVELAVKTIKKAGNDKIIILQCVTNYPSPVADSNLRAMVAMGKRFGVPVGYSDHTAGPSQGGDDPLQGLTVPLGSIALGGVMIEKHVTDDPSRTGPDHAFALRLGGSFDDMVAGIRAMEKALGDGNKRIMPSEHETVVVQRRGAYAARAIEKGEKITSSMVIYLRPAVGVRPPEMKKMFGKKAKRAIAAGAPIKRGDIA